MGLQEVISITNMNKLTQRDREEVRLQEIIIWTVLGTGMGLALFTVAETLAILFIN